MQISRLVLGVALAAGAAATAHATQTPELSVKVIETTSGGTGTYNYLDSGYTGSLLGWVNTTTAGFSAARTHPTAVSTLSSPRIYNSAGTLQALDIAAADGSLTSATELDLAGVVYVNGAMTLTLEVSEANLTAGAGTIDFASDFQINDMIANATVTYTSYFSDSNVAFATTTELYTDTATNSASAAVFDDDTGTGGVTMNTISTTTGLFSETAIITITTTKNADGVLLVSGSVADPSVSEPATIAVLGGALLGLGLVRRRA